MATERRFQKIKEVLQRRQPDLTVLLEKVHKGHNLNAVLRTCDAVGVLEAHAIPLGGTRTGRDLTSLGASKWVSVRSHSNLSAAAQYLKSKGFQIFAADPSPQASDFREVDWTRPACLVLGTEKHGVSSTARSLSDRLVRIPMLGMSASLNVSVAAALLLYEAQRQREAAGLYENCRLPKPVYDELLFEWAHPEIADYCRRKGISFPALDENGDIVEKIPH